jgi:hypothetical protein
MSKEIAYVDKLNIASSNIEHLKTIIKNNIKNVIKCWNNGKYIGKNNFHIIGPAGIGKTQSCFQIAEELSKELNIKFDIVKLNSSVLRRDDMLCPFPDPENKQFSMLFSDFIPKDENSFGLFVIDEMGRGDHDLQQLMWQIQNEHRLHTHDFPKGWFIITLDNPDDQEYSMNTLEDAAGLRRSVHIYCDLSVDTFLKYAENQKFHKFVIDFIKHNPKFLYDFESQRKGRVYSNPASWEKCSDILWGYEMNGGIESNLKNLNIIFPGLLNMSLSRIFIDFVKDSSNKINYEEIINNFESNKSIINKLDNLSLNRLFESIMNHLEEKPELNDQQKRNIALFLCDIPSDIGVMFFTFIAQMATKDRDIYLYLIRLQSVFINDVSEYKNKFFEKMHNLSKKTFNE